jgi:hypothetical protein
MSNAELIFAIRDRLQEVAAQIDRACLLDERPSRETLARWLRSLDTTADKAELLCDEFYELDELVAVSLQEDAPTPDAPQEEPQRAAT